MVRRAWWLSVLVAVIAVLAFGTSHDRPAGRHGPGGESAVLEPALRPGPIEGYVFNAYPTVGTARDICITVGADNAPPLIGATSAAEYIATRFGRTAADGRHLPYWEGATCRTKFPDRPPTSEQIAKSCRNGVVRDADLVSECWSNHAHGRAVDILVKWKPGAYDSALGNEIVDWLLAADASGNAQSNARRLGIQQIIWNGYPRTPGSSSELARCWDVDDRDVVSSKDMPICETVTRHQDHIHLDFTIDGAGGRTSFWQR